MTRVACVGTGFIAGRHLSALAAIDGVEIVAVADPVRERAEQAAVAHGARAYDDGLALLGQEELDAVWLCVPPFAHGPLELAAVERHLPFFVEKPLAVDLATANGIAEQVRAAGLLAAVGYHWRHLEVVTQAADALAGHLPQLFTGAWLDRTPAAPWWSRRAQSGGQLLEQATHLVDLARHLVGPVERVSAAEVHVARDALPDADTPTASAVTLHFASGAIGTITSTCVLPRRESVGTHAVADGLLVELVERSLTDHELRVVNADGEQRSRSDQDPIAAEDREFVAALRSELPGVTVPYDEALQTQAVAWAADRSAQEGRPIAVPRTADA